MGLDSYIIKGKGYKPEPDDTYSHFDATTELAYLRKAYWFVEWFEQNVHPVENCEYIPITLSDCQKLRNYIVAYISVLRDAFDKVIQSPEFALFREHEATTAEDCVHALGDTNWTFGGMLSMLEQLDSNVIPEFESLAEDEKIYFESDW